MEKEYRYVGMDAVEIREEGESRFVEGYVNEFGALSEDLGGFREKVERGAFARSIEQGDVLALWQHDSADPLGRMSNGLLELREDSRGLWFRIKAEALSPRQLEKVQDGTVRNMSFGFFTKADSWEENDGGTVRTLLDVELLEVSPVTFPAYRDSSAAVRSLDAWRKDHGESVDIARRKLELDEADARLIIGA